MAQRERRGLQDRQLTCCAAAAAACALRIAAGWNNLACEDHPAGNGHKAATERARGANSLVSAGRASLPRQGRRDGPPVSGLRPSSPCVFGAGRSPYKSMREAKCRCRGALAYPTASSAFPRPT